MKKNSFLLLVLITASVSVMAQDPTYSTLTLTKSYDQLKFESPNLSRYWIMSKPNDGRSFALYSPDDGGWFTYWKTVTGDMIVYKGKLGVGTTSPEKPLHISSSTEHHQLRIQGTNNKHAWIQFYPSGTGVINWQAGANTNGFSIYDASSSIYRLTVTNTGEVGIGTTSPNEKLDVVGKIQSDYLRVNAVSSSEGGEIMLDGPSGFNDWRIDNYQGKFRLHHSGTNQFTVHPNGQVGIGTGNTSLGNHKLAVEGTIGAREIKVQSTGWSDFVFEREYDLKTLEEVEKYINEKGHLPEIPNEAEVAENGINLGEMDAKLLQKIEELTLYMIDMNKRMNQLETENTELKGKVQSLENE